MMTAKNRIRRRKKAGKKKARPQDKSSGNPRGLTREQMLARVPKDKEWLSTDEVRHVFNDCHIQTIYKMNARKELTPYRTRQSGRANFYSREEVVGLVEARFLLVPASTGENDDGIYEEGTLRGARGRPRKAQAAQDKKVKKTVKRKSKA